MTESKKKAHEDAADAARGEVALMMLAAALPVVGNIMQAALSGINAYHMRMEFEGVKALTEAFQEELEELREATGKTPEELVDPQWIKSDDGKRFVMRILDYSRNYRYAEKSRYFARALLANPQQFDEIERSKLLDVTAQLSLAALTLLGFLIQHWERMSKAETVGSAIYHIALELKDSRGGGYSTGFLVATWNELYNAGIVVNSVTEMEVPGHHGSNTRIMGRNTLGGVAVALSGFGMRVTAFLSPE